MNAKEMFLLISIPVNIILMIFAVSTFINKRKQGKLTRPEFVLKMNNSCACTNYRFYQQQTFLQQIFFYTKKNSEPL